MLADITQEFRRHQRLAEEALVQVDDAGFFQRPGSEVNPLALIVKHLAGNFRSRWTDFLTSDGEKPDRDRDGEFRLTEADSRELLMTSWKDGWRTLGTTLASLTEADLDRKVTIRSEPHTVRQALLRGLTHTAYHVGQILYLVRLLQPGSKWLTVAPGKSREHTGKYLRPA